MLGQIDSVDAAFSFEQNGSTLIRCFRRAERDQRHGALKFRGIVGNVFERWVVDPGCDLVRAWTEGDV